MRTIIHKYKIESFNEGVSLLTIPQEAEFLTLAEDGPAISLWYAIPLTMLETSDIRRIAIRWTGRTFESLMQDKYLGTARIAGLVCHVYDITERE